MNSNFRYLTANYLKGIASERNYIQNSIPQQNLAGWTVYKNTTPGPRPEVSPGGTPDVQFQFYQNTPPIVAADADFGISKPITYNLQGNGVYYDFTIDPADAAKQMLIKFSYFPSAMTGSTNPSVDSDIIIYIADLDKGVLIEPVSRLLQGPAIADSFDYVATFQTNSISTHYRLYFHVATTNTAIGYSLFFNEVSVSKTSELVAAAITDWNTNLTFAPNPSSFGTVTNNHFSYRRIGDSMEVIGYFVSGTLTGNPAGIQLPNNYAVDFSKLPDGSIQQTTQVGSYASLETGSTNLAITDRFNPIMVSQGNPNFVYMSRTGASTVYVADGANTLGSSGSGFSVHFTVPIVGWGTSQIISAIDDRRVVAARFSNSVTQTIPNAAETKVTYDQVAYDTHNAFSLGSSQYTVPVPGIYHVDYHNIFVPNGSGQRTAIIYITPISGSGTYQIEAGTDSNPSGSQASRPAGGTDISLQAGDILEFYIFQNSGGNVDIGGFGDPNRYNYVSIHRIDGPVTPLSGELVAGRYYAGSNLSLPNATSTPFTVGTIDYDTHSAFNPGTGTFTAPMAGIYQFNAMGRFDGGGGERLWMFVAQAQTFEAGWQPGNVSFVTRCAAELQLKMNAGDTLVFNAYQSTGGTINLNTGNTSTWIEFHLIK